MEIKFLATKTGLIYKLHNPELIWTVVLEYFSTVNDTCE